jgi:hypothetical protein
LWETRTKCNPYSGGDSFLNLYQEEKKHNCAPLRKALEIAFGNELELILLPHSEQIQRRYDYQRIRNSQGRSVNEREKRNKTVFESAWHWEELGCLPEQTNYRKVAHEDTDSYRVDCKSNFEECQQKLQIFVVYREKTRKEIEKKNEEKSGTERALVQHQIPQCRLGIPVSLTHSVLLYTHSERVTRFQGSLD